MWDKRFFNLFKHKDNTLKLRFTTYKRDNTIEFIKDSTNAYKFNGNNYTINYKVFLYIFKRFPEKLYVSK